ncbi:MAG: family 16 glycosylhydrolase, partial [Gammaproteobacteria bacterium]
VVAAAPAVGGTPDYVLTPQDGGDLTDWTLMEVSAVAPAGTVEARIQMIHILESTTSDGGSLWWDDASITTGGSVVSGVDLSDYETLKFGIDSSQMTGFADLKLQLEDDAVSSSVFLSDYIPTPNQGTGGNWDVYEIPLADLDATPSQLDLANIVYLGFWNAQDAGGNLTFGPLYFDDIHFVKAIPTVPVLTGVLLDSPVEGVTFQTATQSGVTNAMGEFKYQAGETITFSLGDIVLGTVKGAAIITPVELTGSFDPTNQAATNLLVFLQSIDEDEFHANGITVSAATQAAAVGQALDFDLSSTEFTAAVTPVVDAIAPGNTVVSENTALDSFYLTYVQFGGTDTFIWLFPGYPQIGEPGYELIWTDEFNVGTAPSATNWTLETGYGPDNDGWGNNEWQLYTDSPDNVKLENGNLVITADCQTAPNCGVRDGTITSARINTLNKFSFKYGKIEARIKPAVGNGAWPAFWMLGASFPDIGWPFSGEIDIMEMHNAFSDEFTTHFTMHWCDETMQNPATPGVCFPENEGWTYISQFRTFADSLGDDFHVFSAEWDANGIVGKIDGIEYFNLAIDPGNMDEFLKEFFVILNVAMGGTLGSNNQPPDGTETWPQIMLVDYVRVYQLIGGDGTYTIGGGSSPSDNTLGVYSETNTNPMLPYVQIIDAGVDFGGNSTDPNEFSTAVIPLDGNVSLQALFLDSGQSYGGIIFNFGSAVFPPNPGPGDGQDISNYTTLKFAINTSQVPAFADLKVQLEDGDGTVPGPSVFLSNYTATPAANDWLIYEIPLNDFVTQGLDLTNLTYLGFWNASSATAAETPLVFGPLYFDDIHFISDLPVGGSNLLTNDSFELPDASVGDAYCSGSWNCFNETYTTSNTINNNPPGSFYNPTALSGTQLLKQYGTDAGAFQDVAANPGDIVDAQVFAMNWNGDNFNNIFLLQIFALDASGNNISGGFTPLAQVSAGSDAIVGGVFDYVLAGTDGGNDFDWTQMDVSAVMPAGTASARIQLIHILEASTSNGGAIFLDDASLIVSTP